MNIVHRTRKAGLTAGASSPDISHFRIRSADFQSAFRVVTTVKPTASRRSGLSAFCPVHEISGLDTATMRSADSLAPPSGERVRERGSSHPTVAASKCAC